MDRTMTARAVRDCIGLLIATAWLAPLAQAAPVSYGNFPGATVDFIDVQEDSASDPSVSLYGPPTSADDHLDLTPQGFGASSSGPGSDGVDSRLSFMIVAKPGKAIESVIFEEAGDATLAGLAGNAQSTIQSTVDIEIAEIDGVPTSVMHIGSNLNFNPKDVFAINVDGTGTVVWAANLLLDLGPVLASNGLTGNVTKLNVTFNNALSATSEAGTAAFVQKKDVDVTVIGIDRAVVPEPAAASIAMLAVVASAWVRSRRPAS